jgi:hypothetical protein
MDLTEEWLEGVEWIHQAHDKRPVAGLCEHSNEHLGIS